MAYCRKCGAVIDDEAVICPKCGIAQRDLNNISTVNSRSSSDPKINMIIPIVSMVMFIVMAFTPTIFINSRGSGSDAFFGWSGAYIKYSLFLALTTIVLTALGNKYRSCKIIAVITALIIICLFGYGCFITVNVFNSNAAYSNNLIGGNSFNYFSLSWGFYLECLLCIISAGFNVRGLAQKK